MCNGLLEKIDQFLSLIAGKTYPANESNIFEIPWEWKRDKPKEFQQARENLNNLSQQIWKSYDSMVKMGRKKLKVDE